MYSAAKNMGRALAASLLCLVVSPALAVPLVPNSSTPPKPFLNWDRNTTNTFYGQWNVFNDEGGTGNQILDSVPDVALADPDALIVPSMLGPPVNSNLSVLETTGLAFLTGGGNIYSFSGVTDFDVTLPAHNKGSGWNTRVALQLQTLGSNVSVSSAKLSYDGGSQQLPAAYYEQLSSTPLGGFGGSQIEHLFVFDILNFNPASLLLEFNAASSSMSLDILTLDTFTTTSALTPVPEPASAALLGLGGLGLGWAGYRRRKLAAEKHPEGPLV